MSRCMTLSFILLAVSFLAGCGKKQAAAVTVAPTTQGTGGLSCTATPSSDTVNVEEPMRVTVTVSGGTPPYSVPGNATQTDGSTWVFPGSFSARVAGTTLVRTVTVMDSTSATTCQFQITIRPIMMY